MSQQPRNHLEVSNIFTDKKMEIPNFTCVHCNRMVVMHPERSRPRNVCRKCDALTCDACSGSCFPIMRDAELAYNDVLKQPWMLRGLKADGSDAGEPVRRVDGKLVLARDVGYTDRELERHIDAAL